MVEAGPSAGEPLILSGPDDIVSIEYPNSGLKRSHTTTKKTGGLFGSFFGGAAPKARRISDGQDRPRPKSVYRNEKGPEMDYEALADRTKSKSKRPAPRPMADGDGFTPKPRAFPAAEAEAEAQAQARRAERRAKREAKEIAIQEAEEADRQEREKKRRARRDREKSDLEARRAKERDRARREQEADEQRRDEKRARRAAREGAKAKDEPEMSAEAEARREERTRLRAELEAQKAAKHASSGNKESGRKVSTAEEDDPTKRRGERKSSSRPKTSRTSTAVMDEYFETRNGRGQPAPPDKISSWVHSQGEDPPDPPPLEGTILDGEKPRSAEDEDEVEESRGQFTKEAKRRSRYAGLSEAEIEERRARRKEKQRGDRDGPNVKSASGGSGGVDEQHGRRSRKSTMKSDDHDGYGDGPVKTFDGRPASAPKRNSFFGRMSGFGF